MPSCGALWSVNLWTQLKAWFGRRSEPAHIRVGKLGEHSAKKHLQAHGLKFLTANFRSDRGEIDLIFRDDDCLQYVSFSMNI